MKQTFILLACLVFIDLVAINFVETEYVFMLDAVVVVLWLCYNFLDLAFLVMVFLYPFINAQIFLGPMNIPFVDALAMLVFLAWFVKRILNYDQEPLTWRDFPGVFFAVLFFAAGAASIFNADYFLSSFKYLLRPLVFFYLMFLVLPYNILKNKKQLQAVYKILFAVGVIVALVGIFSIVTASGPWYTKRAVPVAIYGYEFLGGNQNAIAEVLVVTIPVTLILLALCKKYRTQGILILGLLLMSTVLLLTFSRSGWLSLLLELVILFILGFSAKVKKKFIWPLLIVFLILPLILYFTAWQNVSWIQESNASRLLLTDLSINKFFIHPFVGHGLNSFQNLVADTFVYTIEFGDPLESHGFIQKLLVEQGLFGLLTFLGLLMYIFYQYIRAYKTEPDKEERFILMCLLMAASGIVFFQLFSTSYYISRMWLPVGIALAAANIYLKNNVKQKKRKIRIEKRQRL